MLLTLIILGILIWGIACYVEHRRIMHEEWVYFEKHYYYILNVLNSCKTFEQIDFTLKWGENVLSQKYELYTEPLSTILMCRFDDRRIEYTKLLNKHAIDKKKKINIKSNFTSNKEITKTICPGGDLIFYSDL